MTNDYSYSACDVEEAKSIRREFVKQELSDMDRLRIIRRQVERHAAIPSLILGVIASLIFGFGLCLTMVWTTYLILGICVGIIGLAGMIAAYPLYLCNLKSERQRCQDEVEKLTSSIIGK